MRRIIILAVILTALPWTVRAGDAYRGDYEPDSVIQFGRFKMSDFGLLAPDGRVWGPVVDSVKDSTWIGFDMVCDSVQFCGGWHLSDPVVVDKYEYNWFPILKWRIVEEDSAKFHGLYYNPKPDTGRVVEVWEPLIDTCFDRRNDYRFNNGIYEVKHRYRITNCRDTVIWLNCLQGIETTVCDSLEIGE